MKYLRTILAICLAAAWGFCADLEIERHNDDAHYVTVMDHVSGGSYLYTNAFTYPYKMSSIAFRLPANTTNTFTGEYIRVLETLTKQGEVVETNVFDGVTIIETNVYHTITGKTYTYHTNILCAVSSTNAESVVLSQEDGDMPSTWILPGDMFSFTWTCTNEIYFYWDGVRR